MIRQSLLLLMIFIASLTGFESQTKSKNNKKPPFRIIKPGVFEIGSVKILKKEECVEFSAVVNMDKGLLEYLIVGETGKVHESLLSTKVKPYNLQIALLMLGLKGNQNTPAKKSSPPIPEGDLINVWIKWKKKDQQENIRIEQWILKSNRPMKPVNWVFTGSKIYDGYFMAQVDKSIMALIHDPYAMIGNPLPEGANDEIWFVNEEEVPPIGTEAIVIIKKTQK